MKQSTKKGTGSQWAGLRLVYLVCFGESTEMWPLFLAVRESWTLFVD